MMKFFLYCILILLIVSVSCKRATKYNYFCGLAPSSPTDLVIINSSSRKANIDLLVDEDGVKKFGSVRLGANKQKVICIENEGAITAGLYILANGEQTKVVLKTSATNVYQVETKEFKTEY